MMRGVAKLEDRSVGNLRQIFQKGVDAMGRRLSYLLSGLIVLIVAIQWRVLSLVLYTPIRQLLDVGSLGIYHWVYLFGLIVTFVFLMTGFQVQMHRLFGFRRRSVAERSQDS